MEIRSERDSYEKCPNGHPIHEDCLKEWILHSENCPVCSEPYSIALKRKFKAYLEEKEKEKENALIEEERQKTKKKIELITEKIVFLKSIESVESLVEKEKYDEALDKLEALNENKIDDFKGQTVAFYKGKVNFLRGRYDLAINHLFILVKQKYDYPDAFLYLGKSYQELGLEDKAKWAFNRVK